MKVTVVFYSIFFFFFQQIFGQLPHYDRVTYSPERPNQNQRVKISYKIDAGIFTTGSNIHCRILFTGPNGDAVRSDFPKTVELHPQKEGEMFSEFFDVPATATGIVAVFLDSLRVNVDNNNGEGYWIPVFKDADSLPGSFSGIADLYAGYWSPDFYLTQRKDIARKLYERDFEMHPDIKRKFTRYYLNTFDIYDSEDKVLYKEELNRYAQFPDLDEWELYLGVKRYYLLIDEKDSAKKYEKLVFERFPKGSWALQANSLKTAIQIDTMKNPKKKWERYNEFKGAYCTSYPDEFTRMRMNLRLGQLLRGMVLFFAKNNDLATWEKEVDELDEKSKYSTYKRTADFLIERLKSSSLANENIGTDKLLKPETPLFRYESSYEQQLILYGEKLARESATWHREHLNAPRDALDKPYFTEKEILTFREEQLANVLDVLGQNLLLQNKFEEARQVLKEAVDLAKRKEALINEHYTESLIKTNHVKEAINEAFADIRIGKSTVALNDFYDRITEDQSARAGAMKDLRVELKKQMINNEMPDAIVLNTKGEKIKLNELKGKKIIIDFWATWCAPCLIGIESALSVVNKYKGETDVVFLFVNTERMTEETNTRVSKILQEMNNGFNVFFDPDFGTTKAFKVQFLPTIVIIDSKGQIRFRRSGINLKMGNQELSDELVAMIELIN